MKPSPDNKKSAYPIAVDPSKVGEYTALTKSGAGYVYDDILEYRVWIHPEAGGEDLYNSDDYFYSFARYEDALAFSKSTKGAEEPLVLVLQREHINEPEPGRFVHVKEERITEWQVAWLKGNERGPDTIKDFLKDKAAEATRQTDSHNSE